MSIISQNSFAGGELSPSLHSRTDFFKYATGLTKCRNMMVMRHGGVTNRSGSTYLSGVKDSSKTTRIIPFIYSADQAYMIELGEYYARIIKGSLGVVTPPLTMEPEIIPQNYYVKEAAKNIAGITQANPAVVTVNSHALATGDWVWITTVNGMEEVNNKAYIVTYVSPNTFSIQDVKGVNIDSTSYTAYTTSGEIEKYVDLVTEYTEAELFDVNFVQSADVMTMVHPSHHPAELSRVSDTNWTFEDVDFDPAQSKPTAITSTEHTSGSETPIYTVTAVDVDGVESARGLSSVSKTITGISSANPAVVTTATHGLESGDIVHISGAVVGMETLSGKQFVIDVLTTTTYSLRGVDGAAIGTWSSGGTVYETWRKEPGTVAPTSSTPVTVSWTGQTGAIEYNVYKKEEDGNFALLGVTTSTSFLDIGQSTDTAILAPKQTYRFLGTDNYPSTVSYIQQRLVFANTNNNNDKIFMSKTGDFKNFGISSPSQDDDAITFTTAGRTMSEVRSILDLGQLIIMTEGGEWSGNASGSAITPTTLNLRQYSYNGSGALQPMMVSGAALYQQARGSIIRELGFDYRVDGYNGGDLTIFASHLFDDYTIVDWAYQQVPNSIVWVVRSDGVLLGLTYVKDHEIVAWHQHDFRGGLVKSVGVMPSGNEDRVYVIIERTIDGVTEQYIEYINTRKIDDLDDSIFMDSTISWDGRNPNNWQTVTLTGGTTWEYDEDLNLYCTGVVFTAADVGRGFQITDSAGVVTRCTMTAFVDANNMTVRAAATVPVELRGVASTIWTRTISVIDGLDHLEGETVSVFADSNVVASPNNSSYTTLTVTAGQITLAANYGIIHIGLPYVSDTVTLSIDNPQGETLHNKRINIAGCTVFLDNSRGGFVGQQKIDGVETLDNLDELKLREDENYNDPTELASGKFDVTIQSEWNSDGKILIRQVDPLPITILSISPEGHIPMRR